MTGYHVKGSFSNVHNKQIKALAVARWDANMWAASPFSPTRLRPLFGC